LNKEKLIIQIDLKKPLIINGIEIGFKFEDKNQKDFEFNPEKYFINIILENNDHSY
jgi:hypothetical protein